MNCKCGHRKGVHDRTGCMIHLKSGKGCPCKKFKRVLMTNKRQCDGIMVGIVGVSFLFLMFKLLGYI